MRRLNSTAFFCILVSFLALAGGERSAAAWKVPHPKMPHPLAKKDKQAQRAANDNSSPKPENSSNSASEESSNNKQKDLGTDASSSKGVNKMAGTLGVNDHVPDIALPDQTGKIISLKEYR